MAQQRGSIKKHILGTIKRNEKEIFTNIGSALVFGVLYWPATDRLWYDTLHLIHQPLVLAVPTGLVMGNLGNAMKIGASLQMIYLGVIAPGGTLPVDEAPASCITTPVALVAGLEPDIAVTIAVLVGLLGVPPDDLERTYHSYSVYLADKATKKGDMKAIGRAEFWCPFFCSIPLCVFPIILVLLSGTDIISAFLNTIPAWAMSGLSVTGGLLPAFGFAVTITVIGKKELILYFTLGFAIYAYTGVNTTGIAIIAICIAILQSQFTNSTGSTAAMDDDEGDF